MQILPVHEIPENRTSQRTITIGVAIGQYHFVDADGWHHEWRTMTPREWQKKREWEKAGGYAQDEN